MQSVSTPETRVFHTLDALRGIAAIGVVIFHMGQAFAPVAAPGGYLAVDLFFMMSGVVLSHAYEARFRAGMGTLEFMRARLIRLYPLYLLGLLLGVAVTVASILGRNSMNWDAAGLVSAILTALLFLPNLSGRPVDTLFPLNVPSWSLFLEVVVNLLFVLCWPLLKAGRLIAVAVLSGLVVIAGTLHAGHADLGSSAATLMVGFARTIFGFSVGVLIARHVRQIHRGENNPGVLAILAIVIVAIAGSPAGMSRAIWDVACVLVVFPVVVYWGTLIDPGAQLRRVSTFLGVTSYAVYVVHSPLSAVLNSAAPFLERAGGVFEAPWLGMLVLAALLAGAWLVDRYFDMPVRRLLGRIVPKARKVPRASRPS
jgi:peptidoglycan/LPS O-acetylase OafA/YrhL